MSVRIAGKHMEIGDTFRLRIESQIGDAIRKYFDGGFSGQVIVEKSGSRFSADCRVHLDSGANLHAAGEATDPQVAFDISFERIEKRLRRYKRKLKDHHLGPSNNHGEISYTVMDASHDESEEVPENFAPAIVAESTKKLKTMSVAAAVMALDMTDEPVLMFRSPGNAHLNIVYRRQDGNIGWIDAASITG
nr:ribosome-associated translation inhibitor RaiA [uncultured Gellertiella sp.]